jgi:hypothetical protein
MDKKKARNISRVLTGAAVIFILFPLFGVYADNIDAVVFAVIICLAGAFFFREMGKE